MNRILVFILTIFLLFVLVACKSQIEHESVEAIEVVEESTPVPPWQANVPGAAPNFEAEKREPFNLIVAFRDPLFIKTTLSWTKRLQLNQGGSILLFALLILVIAIDRKNWKSWRNLDLVLLLMPSIFLIDATILGNSSDAAQSRLFGFLYLGLFLSTVALFIRALMRGFEASEGRWSSNLPNRILIGLTIFLFLVNVMRTLIYQPNDSGYYTNLGAHRMLTTGRFPYGDSEVRGGAAATYGPVLYVANIPFQLILEPITNQVAPGADSVLGKVIYGGGDLNAGGPPSLAAKLTVIFFHFIGVLGLILLGRKMGNSGIGWASACLYVGSPYVMGLGGEDAFIGGMTYISHIAPTALTILAFLTLGRPLLSGALLALSAGALFYPAFLFPLWLGYYFWKRESWLKFALGFAGAIAFILAAVLLLTEHAPGESVFNVVYESTVGHQEAGDAYGSSTFSFWGTQPGLAAFWQEPFIQGWYLLRPSFILFAMLIGASFFMARGRTMDQLALLTAAMIIAVQLWKSHAGGTYVEWYYPFFLVGLLARTRDDEINETAEGSLNVKPIN